MKTPQQGEYVEQTRFYLSDLINEKQLDELDARIRFKEKFPRTFVGAFDMLMKINHETRESIAPQLHTSERSLREWLNDPERKISADFVIGISLMWQVPDWISRMLLDRAFIRLSEFDRRHQALEYLRSSGLSVQALLGRSNAFPTGIENVSRLQGASCAVPNPVLFQLQILPKTQKALSHRGFRGVGFLS